MTTKTIPEHAYTELTPVSEPVEIRLNSRSTGMIKVLTAWRTAKGTVDYSLTRGGTHPEALSNLQSRAVFPGKAVKGWQMEVIAFAAASIGEIAEIR